jgi:peptidoglycan/LPS O-acetylase OafA/YrhL
MGRRVFTRYLLVLAFFVAVVGLSRGPAVAFAGWSLDALQLEFVFCMAVGSIVAFSFDSLSYVFRSINRNFAVTVAIVALLCARWLIRSIHVAIIVESVASSVIVFVVYYFDEGPVQWFCNLRPVKFYGAISYSFYVNSLIAIHVAGMIVGSLLGNHFLLRNGFAGVVLVAIAALAINTPFSWLTYSWIERPFMRFGRKLDGLIVARRFAAEAANVAQASPLLGAGGQPMDGTTLAPQHYPGS